jgi:hypothetical protein
MSLSTLDTPGGCGDLPPEHSVEAHLDRERAAMEAEWAVASQRTSSGDRWMLVRAAGLGLALAGTIAFGWSQLDRSQPVERFCTADAFITTSGETLTRDHDQGCAWVDADGERVPVDADGNPTG